MKTMKTVLAIAAIAAFSAASATATVIVTYAEQAGAETSSVVGSSAFTFDNLSTGVHTNVAWSGVGIFNQLNIHAADQYGGAGGNTNYAVEGIGSVSQTILNLNNASGYFGMWWSAGDSSNVLDFYSGANGTGTLLAEFTTSNLLKALPKAYYGNPNPGTFYKRDSGEPFAFINFFATPGTAWNSIVFRNASSSGFEGDNYTSRTEVYNPATDGPMPGIVVAEVTGTKVSLVPEPQSIAALFMLGGVSLGGSLFRRLRKA